LKQEFVQGEVEHGWVPVLLTLIVVQSASNKSMQRTVLVAALVWIVSATSIVEH